MIERNGYGIAEYEDVKKALTFFRNSVIIDTY